ncbi:MAG TPA: adenine phosphoribosyltransferase [Jiangellales bacterium]|nr:adenine phosphoribosyltransferase [Jiangellales bacterium]
MTAPVPLTPEQLERLTRRVRDVPDWPEPGVVFKDIAPLLADAASLALAVAGLAGAGRDAAGRLRVDAVAGIEARGFVLGAPVATLLGLGFVPVRKHGKLPGDTHVASYALEYGEATLEIQQDGVGPGSRILLVDDVLATGGTLAAAAELVRRAGGVVVAAALLVELDDLGGRARLPGLAVHSLLHA